MSASSQGNDWLETVVRRLSSGGFKVSRDIPYKGRTFRMVAHRSRFELTKFGNCETFFVFSEFDTLSRSVMRQFSAGAFEYAKTARSVSLPCGLFESVYCFAVAIVEVLDDAVAQSVRDEPPARHWAAAEVPVVYERSRRRLCFFEKTPLWGAAYYAGFRKQIKAFLAV